MCTLSLTALQDEELLLGHSTPLSDHQHIEHTQFISERPVGNLPGPVNGALNCGTSAWGLGCSLCLPMPTALLFPFYGGDQAPTRQLAANDWGGLLICCGWPSLGWLAWLALAPGLMAGEGGEAKGRD